MPTHTHTESWDVSAHHPAYHHYSEYYNNDEADSIGQEADAILEHQTHYDYDPYADITHYYQEPYHYSNEEADSIGQEADAMLEHRGHAPEDGHNPYDEVTQYY